MSRWHEPDCRRPDIVAIDGMPYCNYCMALSSVEEASVFSTPPPSQLSKRSQMNLSWPPVVKYSRFDHSLPTNRLPNEGGNCEPISSKLQHQASIFPEITRPGNFRLLRLKPGHANAPIRADFMTGCLTDNPIQVYDALSYTWAADFEDHKRCCPVFIGVYWDILLVTQNCSNALRAIRHQNEEKLIWVDSLCIDHGNPDDKNQQTGLMHGIYSNASSVIAYLGTSSETSDIALDFLGGAIESTSLASAPVPIPGKACRTALQNLFHRPFFSRLWVIPEVLLAQELRITCGSHSVLWPKSPQLLSFLTSYAPSWLCKENSWCGLNSQNVLHNLLKSSPYETSDPRDKVFGMLCLLYDKHITPNYSLPAEVVYTGISAYLIKDCRSFDILALAGIYNSHLDMPSWAPDWSQKLTLHFPDAMLLRLKSGEEYTEDTNIEINTGAMKIQGTKLCDILGKVTSFRDHSEIVISMGKRGNLVIGLLNSTYKVSTDSLFLLNGWDYPVILRRCPDKVNSYVLVSVCALFFAPPSRGGTWLIPWDNPSIYPNMPVEANDPDDDIVRLSGFSPEDNDAIRAFHSVLSGLSGATSLPTPELINSIHIQNMRRQVLGYIRLWLTAFRKVESTLRATWTQLKHNLRWLFRDQTAVWKLLQKICQMSAEKRAGEDIMQLDDIDASSFERYGKGKFPSTYSWALDQFCWSFIKLPTPNFILSETISAWTPVYDQMTPHLPEIQKWAQTTEQLFKIFQYSENILGKESAFSAGTQHLSAKWSSKWEDFRNAMGESTAQWSESSLVDADCFWDWTEFENSLEVRERLWNEIVPSRLDPAKNCTMAAQLGLRILGLELDDQRTITIV